MMLTVTHSDEQTIAIPIWLIQTLGLQEGQQVEATAFHHLLHFSQAAPLQPQEQTNGNHKAEKPALPFHVDEDSTLEAFITTIKTLPPNPDTIVMATKSGEMLLAELEANPPSSELFTFQEWQTLWRQHEEEEKALEYANERAEGLRE